MEKIHSKERRCPSCKKKFASDPTSNLMVLPFCSKRCRDVDLGNWLDERYIVAKSDLSELDEDQLRDLEFHV